MFKKLASWLSDDKQPAKRTPVKAAKKAKPVKQQPASEDDPAMLIRQAILEAEQTIAMEEKVAGHDPDHLQAVQGAMMIYRQKQESLDDLPLKEKARLRAMGEAMFGGQLSEAEKNAKKIH